MIHIRLNWMQEPGNHQLSCGDRKGPITGMTNNSDRIVALHGSCGMSGTMGNMYVIVIDTVIVDVHLNGNDTVGVI